MKKLINFTIMAICCLAIACHKDAQLTRMQPVKFNSTVTASTNMVTLSANTDSTDVLTLKWSAAQYPVQLKVTYTVQIDVPTDTATWANAKTTAVGADILTKTIKGGDLNSWALALGIGGNDTGKLVFRIQSYQDRNAYSKPVVVSVATYVHLFVPPPPPASLSLPVLYLPGFYQSWSPGTAGTVAAEQPGIYEGYIYMPVSTDPSAYHFKFTSAPDWGHINYGDAGGGKLSTDGSAGDLVLPGPGFYELVANTTTLTWSYTAITWSIIGDATPGGWSNDTEMTYDPKLKVWKVTADMKASGSYKFRANNAWSIDFGLDASSGRIAYADNPAYPYNGSIQNLTVAADGNYTIYLDLNNPNSYYYYLEKH